jgi:hypothetical protein
MVGLYHCNDFSGALKAKAAPERGLGTQEESILSALDLERSRERTGFLCRNNRFSAAVERPMAAEHAVLADLKR